MLQIAGQIIDWLSAKLNLRIQPARRPQGKKARKRLDVSKLNQDSVRQAFLADICNQLDAINLSSEDPEINWTIFHKKVHSSAINLAKKIMTGLMRLTTKFKGFLKKSTDCTRHAKIIPAQYPKKQPTATFVRQSRPTLGTCKIPV